MPALISNSETEKWHEAGRKRQKARYNQRMDRSIIIGGFAVLLVAACSSGNDNSSGKTSIGGGTSKSSTGGSLSSTPTGSGTGAAATAGGSGSAHTGLESSGSSGSTGKAGSGGSSLGGATSNSGATSNTGGASAVTSGSGGSAQGGSSSTGGSMNGTLTGGGTGTATAAGGSGLGTGGRGGSGGGGAVTSGGSSSVGGTATGGGSTAKASGGSSVGGTTTSGGGSGGSTQGGSSSTDDIGTWTDAPGACPNGMTKIDITTASDLEDAANGNGTYESDPASVCYFIRNGRYEQTGSTPLMYVTTGGTDATHRRVFVGESRSGVILMGRANIESGVSHVQISNLTIDLTGFSQSGSFNTLNLPDGCTDLRIDHVTFTGDCQTGANGGHIEVDGSADVIVEECVIEKFGRCGPNGHQDHGVYLSWGSNIILRNNDIRGNASRGIQFNGGTVDNVTIERNRIHENGHADYEDGIVMNATGANTISNVTIEHNLIYGNYYSGIRETGNVFQSVVIRNNTFYMNGAASSGSGRSEVNLDDTGSGAETSVTRNIMVAANRVLNSCYDSQPRGYALTDNVVQGTVPSGDSGNCISGSMSADPMFSDAANANFHTQNATVSGYGAYAP